MGRTLAMSFMFGVSPRLCFDVKTFIFLALVLLAAITYTALEIRLKTYKTDGDAEKVVMTQQIDDVTEAMMQKPKVKDPLASVLELSGSLAGSLSGSCANVNIQS